jgi:hypothetical protein
MGYGVLHAILQVFIIIVYENVFQNPELFRTQVSLSTDQSTLDHARKNDLIRSKIFKKMI